MKISTRTTSDKLSTLLSALYTRGPEQPMSRADAATILGMHPRDVQDVIAELQDTGHKIVSDRRGYWVPRGPEDSHAIRKAARTRGSHGASEMLDARRWHKWADELEKHAAARQERLFA